MNAAEVLAQHRLDEDWDCPKCDCHFSQTVNWAQHLIDELKAAGYAVIDATGGYDDRQTLMEDMGFAVNQDMPGSLVIATLENEEVVALHSVRHARQMAAAWNAAADAAEASPSLLITDHFYLPVAGHPDDNECTHRPDGTDATYCGEPRQKHIS